MTLIRQVIIALTGSLVVTLSALVWYIAQPPNLGRLSDVSVVLRGTDDRIINLSLTDEGYWREPIKIKDIDPELIEVLVAYEDQRFWEHRGVDLKAISRAALNAIKFGKVSSGASTLTMQTVRLLDTSLRQHSLLTKIRQMIEARRLEQHWSKEEILEAYFTLAPYGGNIEGIKAATEAWFQKTPAQLTLNEIAILVALPQSPERRRPDRFPADAYQAKQLVLAKVAPRLGFQDQTVQEVIEEPLPTRLIKPESHALHLAQRLASADNKHFRTTINSDWQREVQNILAQDIQTRSAPIQAAAMIVERKTGLVRAYVGSATYSSQTRKGAINYLTALRSPGSTLKPLVYAKALNRNLITYEHVFDDTAYFKSGYRPTNFSEGFGGKVSLKQALLTSLNIPAIRALEKVGPDLLQAELNTYLDGSLNSQQLAGLSLAVGGLYLTPEQLMNIYMGLVDPGYARRLSFTEDNAPMSDFTLVTQNTANQIQSLLIQDMANGERVAFKTGTSFARQDAWSVQIYDKHLVLVWVGTPDNEPTTTLTGVSTAFPISLEIGRSLGLVRPAKPKVSQGKSTYNSKLATSCKRLISYPEDGAWIKSISKNISIIGGNGAAWYLNGVKIGQNLQQIEINEPGVQLLTAQHGDCTTTHEIFVE
ncbi:penicillin-binding protein 1C [Nereida sp. NH-UV-3]|uniref:penicillin-binding protein 1C n=1 Tax=Nereida TaxID=282198 RepID=UPI0036F21F95